MASYVIHDIAGEELLKVLKEKMGYDISSEEHNRFLMGNLIPDSSKLRFSSLRSDMTKEELKEEKKRRKSAIQQEKQITHFRSTNDTDKNVQVPKLDFFLQKYGSLISKDVSVLGYLFHLYTDKVFFGDLFNNSFIFLDAYGNETNKMLETKSMILKKDNQEYDVTTVFSYDSDVSIYSDYTRMNSLLLSKYQVSFPYQTLMQAATSFENPGIEEVDYSNISSVLTKTSKFIEESKSLKDYTLRVFNQTEVENFITSVVESFINQYENIISGTLKRKHNSYVPKKVPTNGE